MQSFRKIEWAVSEIFKDGLTDGLTDKGDYYGPRRVNPGSKNEQIFANVVKNGLPEDILLIFRPKSNLQGIYNLLACNDYHL